MYVWNVALKTARECIPILGRYLILQLHAAKLSKTLQIQNNSDLKSKNFKSIWTKIRQKQAIDSIQKLSGNSEAEQSRARLSKAEQGRARPSKAEQSRAKPSKAEQSWVKLQQCEGQALGKRRVNWNNGTMKQGQTNKKRFLELSRTPSDS